MFNNVDLSMNWPSNFYLFTAACIVSAVLTGILLHLLSNWAVLDHPNERSSHQTPTPRGGGLAVMVVVFGLWVLSALMLPNAPAIQWAMPLSILAMTAIFWFEDIKGLSLLTRLGVQLAITMFLLLQMGAGVDGTFLVFQGLFPPIIDLVITWLLWVWFINLFNFMDGIDGISVAETITISLGVAAVALIGNVANEVVVPAIVTAGAMTGFFIWNRPPAKIFLGDVGSIPLGLLMGWVLLKLAVSGLWVPALILPLYYLSDATITLLKRALRGEKFWHAHNDHFYQAAIKRGLSHSRVSSMVFVLGLALVGLAVFSLSQPFIALGIATALVGGFLVIFSKG